MYPTSHGLCGAQGLRVGDTTGELKEWCYACTRSVSMAIAAGNMANADNM